MPSVFEDINIKIAASRPDFGKMNGTSGMAEIGSKPLAVMLIAIAAYLSSLHVVML